MKKLGIGLALLLATTAYAAADSVTVSLSDSTGGTASFGPDSSGFFSTGPFNIGGFNVNTITVGFRGSPNGVAPPTLVDTNTLNVDNSSTTLQTLTIDVTSTGSAPPSGLQNILNSFDSVGLTAGWSMKETTFVNGVAQASTTFTGTGGVDIPTLTDFGPGPFTIDTQFVIENGSGTGSGIVGDANGGINVESVPGPVVGAGLPGLVTLLFGGVAWWRRRVRAVA